MRKSFGLRLLITAPQPSTGVHGDPFLLCVAATYLSYKAYLSDGSLEHGAPAALLVEESEATKTTVKR